MIVSYLVTSRYFFRNYLNKNDDDYWRYFYDNLYFTDSR